MNEKKGTAALIMAALALICSVISLGILLSGKGASQAPDTQYVMYVGTGIEPGAPSEEVKGIVDDVCLKYFSGYTLQEATGAWTNDDGKRSHEYTLVCYIDGADKESVYAAADELRIKLGQECILIETDTLKTDFYYGPDGGQ